MRFRTPNPLVDIYKVFFVWGSILAFGFAGCTFTQETVVKEPQLCVGHYHNEQAAIEQLAGFARRYSNLKEWKARILS